MLMYLLIALLLFLKFRKEKEKEKEKGNDKSADSSDRQDTLRLLKFSTGYFLLAALFSLAEIISDKKFHTGDIVLVALGLLVLISVIIRDFTLNPEEIREKEKDREREEILNLPRQELTGFLEKNKIDPDEFTKAKKEEENKLLPGEEEEIPGRKTTGEGGRI